MDLDNLCIEGKIKEEIFAQIGNSDYEPKNYTYVKFLNRELFEKKIKDSSLVITHSGVGSIITAINADKPVIVYPRLSKYHEHVDNHQLEIAEAFVRKNFVLLCGENDNLCNLIDEARKRHFEKYVSQTDKIIDIVRNSI